MNHQSSHVPYVVPEDFPHRFSPNKLDFTIMWGKCPLDKLEIVKDRYADSLLYEDTQIAPLLIRVPGLEPGRDDRPAMFLDIPPTVSDLLGFPAHPGFQGINLFDRRPNPDRSIYMIVQTPVAYQSAIVRSDYKFLLSEREGVRVLFDLTRDPGEKRKYRDVSAGSGRRTDRPFASLA